MDLKFSTEKEISIKKHTLNSSFRKFSAQNRPKTRFQALLNKALEKGNLDHIDFRIDYDLSIEDEQYHDRQSLSFQYLESKGYPFTQFGGRHPMPQSIPTVDCFNPLCKGNPRTMDVFGVVWPNPVKNVYLWDAGDYKDDSGTQIVYQICSSCQSIHVCNRSGF